MEPPVTIERIVLEPSLEIYRASGTVPDARQARSRADLPVTCAGHVVAEHVMPGQVLVDLEANDVRAAAARSRAGFDHATERHGDNRAARGLFATRLRDGFTDSCATGLSAEASSIEGPQ
jgi:hypothetical protein